MNSKDLRKIMIAVVASGFAAEHSPKGVVERATSIVERIEKKGSDIDVGNIEIRQLVKLCRDFQADCHDGFVSNDELWVESWVNKYLPPQGKPYNTTCNICGKKFYSSQPDDNYNVCPTCYF